MSWTPSDTASGKTYLSGIGPVDWATALRDGNIHSLSLKTPNKATEIRMSPSGALTDVTISGGLGTKPVHIHFSQDKDRAATVTVDGRPASQDVAKNAVQIAVALMNHPAYLNALAHHMQNGLPAARHAIDHALNALNAADAQLAIPSNAGRIYRGALRSQAMAIGGAAPQSHLAPDAVAKASPAESRTSPAHKHAGMQHA
jgi:hypothetical protein